MKCHYCSNTATVHLTEILQKQKKELHLCEACAREHHLPQQELNVNELLAFLINEPALGLGKVHPVHHEFCTRCGMKYAQFRAQGRLGCPEDYEVFKKLLVPLLERIHRSSSHQGKSPRRVRSTRLESMRQELENRLRDAVAAEEYEEAARLRDRLRSMGANDES